MRGRGSRWRRRARPSTSLSTTAGRRRWWGSGAPSQMAFEDSYKQYTRRSGFTLNAMELGESDRPEVSGDIRGNGGNRNAVRLTRCPCGRRRHDRARMAIGRPIQALDHDRERPGADHLQNKAELSLTDGFASKIEPAATDKDAFIVAHPGAAEYINDEIKSFVERYSDLMYVALAALSIIGTIFAAIYTKVTRIAPGEGQPARNRHSRCRRAHGIRQIAGCARRISGRTGNYAAPAR